MRRFIYTLVLAVLPCGWGQYFEPPPLNPDPIAEASKPTAAPAPPKKRIDISTADNTVPVPREYTRVAVLGYHNFSDDPEKPVTRMLMRPETFRRQMEEIRRAGLRVISMKEFLDWRLGDLKLPPRCVLITLDDGWRSVYEHAYPILKEYGYPFTLFLYTQFLSGKGDSMTPAMIREMQAHGATIGSHSVSHLFPQSWKEVQEQGEQEYIRLMDHEMGDSYKQLSKLFGPINTYCYPGGYITPPMLDRLPGYGYVAAFGVIPGKVSCTEDVWQIHRYMVLGVDESSFRRAMDFDPRRQENSAPRTSGVRNSSPVPPFPVFPEPNSSVPADFSTISAQMGSVENIDVSSVHMTVSGFGRVPARVDASSATVQWTPPYRIYLPTLTVVLTWKTFSGAPQRAEWFFHIDREVNLKP